MAKGDFQKGVTALQKAVGCSRKEAMDRYRKGDRADNLRAPSEPQESIGNLKGSSPAELTEMADVLLLACGKDFEKAQSVLKFVSEISG